MSAHAPLVVEPPVSAIRPVELGITGLPGRRLAYRNDFRREIRTLLTRSAVPRHRVTFIPLGTQSFLVD